MLQEEQIENYSGVNLRLTKCIPVLKKGHWFDLGIFPSGDAPKSFISLYEYSEDSQVRKCNPSSWPKYIAKVGHKWYPLESINEYLFNQIGEVLGLNMASSKLIIAGKQLRFLSRYFLNRNESLEHGAQIFAGYISDKEWVEQIEQQGLARKFFTFQFAETAIEKMFPNESKLILPEFVKMLVFDALTGNNDRHFYNWGVVKHIESKKIPIFAPVYDSARGLFWNQPESNLLSWYTQPKQIDEKIKKYSEGSKPKIGWKGLDDLNHFDLIDKIYSRDSRYKDICSQLINQEKLDDTLRLLKVNFSKFYSKQRIELIEKCLIYRFNKLMNIIKQEVQND
jgi:hypothetical protein